ncbi:MULTISPECIES: branched-chain amino acid ABC transporter permease [unclassified Devosia]|uniref:branched-chain amino acid ABC transporter permease n=1 Tax=unclassified Devosia TaxID=196773 RepID=UPI0015FBE3C8|nr:MULTISPECIES: branched-chain amino acid ABC transporter permease [unclassified Devosia]MBJ6987811.1 branched-chain amino acid ABC transporter permease [Devosia sp. MC521]MBJ7579339.1 branched-chain amino acid ABC transporter permease [Devosia sp. MC532]MBK1796189.1 branched-chain amino acid ABC transporter permease [Devosia sp. WQ 349K1]QMW63719.1 branched-chain amino acid ABC transporter permease [Devosia sp. MC521]
MDYVNTIVQGILLGGLYALYAAGLSLIFGVMRLINLAHGDLIVLAAFVLLAMVTALGLPLPVALLILLPFAFALGWALQRFLLNRTLGDDILLPLLVTFGLQILVQNGLLVAFSADSRKLSLGAIETQSVNILGLNLGVIPLLTFAVAVAVLGVLSYIFYGTALGRRLRATSDSTEVVQLMGVNPRVVFAVAMGISFVVLTIAAFFMGIRSNFDPSVGPARLLFAFEAVVIGGLGSLWGTLAGGVILGVSQAIGARINPEWQILAGHLVFLVFIILRPRGLFPKQ